MDTSIDTKHRFVWEYTLTRRKALEIREGDRAEAPEDVARFLRALGVQNEEQEHFLTIVLDAKHQIRGFFTVTIGLLDRTQIHAREVFRTAIIQGASRVILAHNHPSGDPTPSAQDIAGTRDMVTASKVVGIDVLDHIVIGLPSPNRVRDYISFREANLM